jgi:DNA-directed RNA polymerase subunit RPC12/RpoP
MKNDEKKHSDAMLLTLCARCAAQFYNSDEHIIRRTDMNQKIKETCTYCGFKQGWDYSVERRAKR